MKYKLIVVVVVFFCCFSCKKNISLDNLNGDKIGCFGHAGMGSKSIYPTNTLQSFETCLNKGADGTEMDIQVTNDGVLVIFHNDNLSGLTECGGVIRDLNWSDIETCRLHSALLKNLNVISFDEFIQSINSSSKYTFTFDCKLTSGTGDDNEYYQRFAKSIVSTINTYGLDQNTFIESSDPAFLSLIHTLNSELKLFYLAEDIDNDIKIASQNNFYGISVDNDNISSDQVTEAHNQNLRVTLYGVETNKQNYDAVLKQPDYIQTDDLDYLLRIFGKLNRHSGNFVSLLNNLKLQSSH